MSHPAIESKFVATEEKGDVSSLLICPPEARWLLVLGHGAGAGMRHRTMETIAQRLADAGMATFRYQFPYMERGGGGRDSKAVTLATIRAAVAAAHQTTPDLALLAGGHSFGGRMTSVAAAEAPLDPVQGLVFFAFPLHAPGRPGTERAAHLADISVPMLFLSGTRDTLAQRDLLRSVHTPLKDRATLHWLDTANHGYKILKRSRQSNEDVFVEMARVVTTWAGGF